MNVIGVPVQVTPPFIKVGVTVMVATIVVVPLLIAVNCGIFPVPLAPNPIVALLFVQLKVVPATVDEKFIGPVKLLAQVVILATGLTCGVGFTVIVNVIEGPLQGTPPLVYVAFTVNVELNGVVPAFVAII